MSIFTSRKAPYSLVVALVALNFILLAFLWFGHPRYGMAKRPGPRGPEQVHRFLQKELGLSSEQLEQFKVLREAHLAEAKKIREGLSANRKAMFEAFGNSKEEDGKTDSVVLNSAAAIGNLQRDLELHLIKHFQDLEAICTPDQKLKLKEVILKAMQPRRPRRR